ncbi:hypothetical protein M408DRAFT_330065 [Serendipita vermifera MAFF 305830]|uniref:Uncharacterized protein n=1 Tax=Serendipita vermifera MAFF 305830 TaxID=933852 RepID=A0A0C2XE05_SERVB|nr:hypothetical protein M408DRAFT_330065 [Serendipita vermifera MAFF 305830]
MSTGGEDGDLEIRSVFFTNGTYTLLVDRVQGSGVRLEVDAGKRPKTWDDDDGTRADPGTIGDLEALANAPRAGLALCYHGRSSVNTAAMDGTNTRISEPFITSPTESLTDTKRGNCQKMGSDEIMLRLP